MSPRILLLAPAAHGYGQSVARGFSAQGHHVLVHEYDRADAFPTRLRTRVTRGLTGRLGRHLRAPSPPTHPTADAVRDYRPDIALVIRGVGLETLVLDALDDVGATTYLWLWDEIRRRNHTDAVLERFEHLISYSSQDAQALAEQGIPCIHVPTAFDHTMVPARARHTPQAVFLGTRSPHREQLLSSAAAVGVPILAVGNTWRRGTGQMLRRRGAHPKVPAVRELQRPAAYEMAAGAPAAINIHENQDGFNLRTFEIPGSGGVQLIDREDVQPLLEPGREVLVFHTAEELVELCQRAIRDDRWGDTIREAGRQRVLAEHTFTHRARKIASLWA